MNDTHFVNPMAVGTGAAEFGLILSTSGKLANSALPIWRPDQGYLTAAAHCYNMLTSYTHGTDADCQVTFWTLDSLGVDISMIGPMLGPSTPTSALGGGPGGSLEFSIGFRIPLFNTTGKIIYGFRWVAVGYAVAPSFTMTFFDFV